MKQLRPTSCYTYAVATEPEPRAAETVRRAHRRVSSRRSAPLSADGVRQAIDDAEEAVTLGAQTRERNRRRRLAGRCNELHASLTLLALVQGPLRAELGRLPRAPRRDIAWGDDVRAASEAVIRERKKLRKMMRGC